MSLFQIRGSLRIGNGLGFGAADEAGLTSGETPPYLESLAKLFPAEGAALGALAAGFAEDRLWLSILLTILIAGMVFVLRIFATQPDNGGKTDWIAVVISTISFFLFALSIRAFGTFLGGAEAHSSLMAVIAGIWTGLVPLFPKKS
jgi:hypothetical protein